MLCRPSGVLESITIASAYIRRFSSVPFGNIIGDRDVSHNLPAIFFMNILKRRGLSGHLLLTPFV